MPLRQDGRRSPRSMEGRGGVRSPQPERRQLTVMFCDLIGSTALSRQLDPEDLLDILRLYRSACSKGVDDHGGHISRYMGDGMLALFGYPIAHENDAERGTHAALAIATSVSALRVPRYQDLRLSVRIGMATGLVVAGDIIGEGPSREEAIIGETPNLAARLQTLAAPNTVVISDETRTLLRDAFDYRSLGEHSLKGFDAPVQAWQVLGASDAETRFDAAQTSNAVPLVNRCTELDLMHRLWKEAKSTSSRILLLGGEAGIGKSRLAKTFCDRVAAAEPASLLQLQCSPHHQFSAFHPFIRYLERAAGFERDDSVEAKRNKLRMLAGDKALPVYNRLLALRDPAEGENVVEFSPRRQRDFMFATVLRRLREIAKDNAVLVFVEDIHWMDPTSLELQTYLIDNIANARVLFILTYRPEFSPTWGNRPNATTLVLDALDESAGQTLAQSVIGEKEGSSAIVAQIVARTEGMPLFIEELAKSLVESGTLGEKPERRAAVEGRGGRAIPISLMESLTARIDRLGDAKAIAQIGAVVGLEFSHALLERVVLAEEPDLETALTQLVSSGLLRRHDTKDEVRYVFKHALVRDAAYNSLLRRRRETLHARIAACLEDNFRDVVANEPELLAEHYSEAGLAERAIRYWRRAGQRASERSENLEAENHFKNALMLLEDLQDSKVTKELELSLLIGLGPVEIAIGGPGSKQACDVYERAVALCEKLPNSPLHFAAHWGQWRVSRTYRIKRDRADRLSVVTEYLGDQGLSLQAHHCQWAVLFNLGSHNACCEHVEHGIKLYEAGDYRSHAQIYGGHDPAVCGHGQSALSLWMLGFPEQGMVRIEQALRVAQSLSHAGSELHALEIALMFHRFRQDVDEVLMLAERMIALAREEEFATLEVKGELFRDWARGRQGQAEQAIEGLTEGVERLRSIDASEDLPFFFDMLADCCALGGRTADGLRALDHAFDEAEKTASLFWVAELHRRKGELLLQKAGKRKTGVRQAFEDAIKTAREQEARTLELRAATSYAQWLSSRNERAAAAKLLTPIYEQFTEGFDGVDLASARACLDALGSGDKER